MASESVDLEIPVDLHEVSVATVSFRFPCDEPVSSIKSLFDFDDRVFVRVNHVSIDFLKNKQSLACGRVQGVGDLVRNSWARAL